MAVRMSSIPKILVVSDLQTTLPLWAFPATQQQWDITLESRPTKAVERWAELLPDLIVCDIESESVTLDVVTMLREHTMSPILLLTSHRSDQFMLDAYAAGGDECVLKPVHPLVFEAKLTAWLRRSPNAPVDALEQLKVDDVELIPSEQSVVLDDREPIHLTNLEWRLLYYLMRRPGHTLSIKELCLYLWRQPGIADSSTLKNLVYRLRRKIEPDPAHPQYVHTVFGVGYRFMAT